MKKLLLFITVLFFGYSTINAQDDVSYGYAKGDILAAGSITYSSDETSTTDESSFTFAPSVHYFMSDDWSFGLGIGLMTTDGDAGEVSDTEITLSARNYFLDLNDRNKIYLSLGLGLMSGDSYAEDMQSLGAGFGFNYFMTENIILDFELANLLSYTKQGDDTSMKIGWDGTMNNRFASPTLGVIFKF